MRDFMKWHFVDLDPISSVRVIDRKTSEESLPYDHIDSVGLCNPFSLADVDEMRHYRWGEDAPCHMQLTASE